jgi:hypothetical protein
MQLSLIIYFRGGELPNVVTKESIDSDNDHDNRVGDAFNEHYDFFLLVTLQ